MFSAITMADQPEFERIFRGLNSFNSDYSFVNCYGWQDAYRIRKATVHGCVCLKFYHPDYGDVHLFPAGGDVKSAVEELRSQSEGKTVFLGGEEMRDYLTDAEFREARELFDYIHPIRDFAAYDSKALRTQRQQSAAFCREYPEHRFLPLDFSDTSAVDAVERLWENSHIRDENRSIEAERAFLDRILSQGRALRLVGGVLVAEDQPAAITIGSFLNPRTLDVHVEKALTSYKGVYAALRKAFAEYLIRTFPELQYFNREDDMGLDNLREAKLRLKPEFLLKKYFAVL